MWLNADTGNDTPNFITSEFLVTSHLRSQRISIRSPVNLIRSKRGQWRAFYIVFITCHFYHFYHFYHSLIAAWFELLYIYNKLKRGWVSETRHNNNGMISRETGWHLDCCAWLDGSFALLSQLPQFSYFYFNVRISQHSMREALFNALRCGSTVWASFAYPSLLLSTVGYQAHSLQLGRPTRLQLSYRSAYTDWNSTCAWCTWTKVSDAHSAQHEHTDADDVHQCTLLQSLFASISAYVNPNSSHWSFSTWIRCYLFIPYLTEGLCT